MATFPLQDQSLTLPSGRIVRIYNLVSLTQSDDPSSLLRIEPTIRIQYGTAARAEQQAERSTEAAEVIAYFLGEAPAGLTVTYAEICATPAQAARQESPEASVEFRRGADGVWRLVGDRTAHWKTLDADTE